MKVNESIECWPWVHLRFGSIPPNASPSEGGTSNGGTHPAIAGLVPNHCGDHHLSHSKGTSVARVASQGRSKSRPFSTLKPKGGPQHPRYRSAYVAAERQSAQTLPDWNPFQDRLAAHRLKRPATRTTETPPVFSSDVLSRSISAV